MSKLENKGDREVRITCVDMATRVVGKPEYHMVKDDLVKRHEDVVEVAEKIYKFVTAGDDNK